MTRLADKRSYWAASVIAILILFLLPGELLAAQFKVTRVYDGDTVKAEGHDIKSGYIRISQKH